MKRNPPVFEGTVDPTAAEDWISISAQWILLWQKNGSGQGEMHSVYVEKGCKDMLKVCMLDFPRSWAEIVPLMGFAYNKSYHQSLGMSPFEALYGRKCQSPILI